MDNQWPTTIRYTALIMLLAGVVLLLATIPALINALFIAILVTYLLEPLVRIFKNTFRLSPVWAVSSTFALLFVTLGAFSVLLGTAIRHYYVRIISELQLALRALEYTLNQPVFFLGFEIVPGTIIAEIEQVSQNTIETIPVGAVGMFGDITVNLLWGVVIFSSVFYFLKDGQHFRHKVAHLFPEANREDVYHLLDEINDVWGIFLRVQLFIFFVLVILMGSGTFLVIWLFRSGLLEFSPITFVLLLILVYTAAQQVDNLWLRPQMMGKSLQLHPGVVFATLASVLLIAGPFAALLAVPALATLKIIIYYLYCQVFLVSPWSDHTSS